VLRPSAWLRCLAIIGLLALPARSETVMRLASATVRDVQHEWQKAFTQEPEARIGHTLRVTIHPASELGLIPQMLASMPVRAAFGYAMVAKNVTELGFA
jgi:TRAP-type C4-dicarboxylate transport system substrate-binding protein